PEPFRLPISLLATWQNIIKGLSYIPKHGVSSEVLESLAIAISLYRKDYFAANTTNFLLGLSEQIEDNIARKSDSMLQSLLVPSIKEVWIEKDGAELKIAFEELKKGDVVIINAGDTTPIDGTVISGEALLDESSMTGEALPVKKARGDRATSGTIVKEGRLRVWAEQVGEQSATYKIASMIKNSLSTKSNAQIEASRLADKLVPVTLGLAGFAYLATRDLGRVAAVFQADYSCALKLATPVAFKSAMYQASKEGALIKSAGVMEKIAAADTIIFDKTGTLSSGKLLVSDVFSLDSSWSEDAILSLAASIEEHYFHPIAEAVVSAAKSCERCRHFSHSEVEFIVAHGVGAYVEGKKVVIGSRHFLEDDEHIEFGLLNGVIDEELKKGRTLLYIGYEGKLLGAISMIDELRSNAHATIEKLRKLGVKEVVMLTGDHEIKARETAKELGLDAYYSGLLPQDKLDIVKKLKAQGKRLMFAGDGINDAPSLAECDVGIAMQRGADVARVTADVALLVDDISIVAAIKELSNKTIAKVSQNYYATTWINSGILLFATFGALSPVATS
ncbi:MAG TPA: heavy metal translocating P-type ATPase, partial [Campylobacterales bacterium]|nr:heavy metal translocating P-type ATPase [Campylobacterales bacterium]